MANRTPLHIVILCSRLDLPAGIERAIANLSNLFADKGHRVSLIILDETDKSFYPLRKEIFIKSYPLDFGITDKGNVLSRKSAFIKDIFKLKKILKELEPEIIISTEYVFSIASTLAGAGKKAKLFSWEHHHFNWLQKNKFWNFLFRKTYPRLDTVICLNEKEKHLFEAPGCTAIVIPNFIPQFPQQKATLNKNRLLTIGWLIKRKGVDMIPYIAELVFKKHPDWNWQIIGSGGEYQLLKERITEKNLEKQIQILSPVNFNIEELYRDASMYVMTSRFECFPMVLLEAMSCGIPCISFDCPTGPSDIIRHEEDGLLIEKENIYAMADAICRLIEIEQLRIKMGENAFENVKRFSSQNVYDLWKSILLISDPNADTNP